MLRLWHKRAPLQSQQHMNHWRSKLQMSTPQALKLQPPKLQPPKLQPPKLQVLKFQVLKFQVLKFQVLKLQVSPR